MIISDQEIAFRLALSLVYGGVIGYERQAHHKSAGLRTHMLVSIGSSLIMILSINIYSSVQGLTNADPTRLAAQVVSGIGFLGAGAILKEGISIRGLTTAASLWVVSCVGLAVGSGSYISATIATLFSFLTLTIFTYIEKRTGRVEKTLVIHCVNNPEQIGKVVSRLGECGLGIYDVKVETQDKIAMVSVLTNKKEAWELEAFIVKMTELPGVASVKAE